MTVFLARRRLQNLKARLICELFFRLMSSDSLETLTQVLRIMKDTIIKVYAYLLLAAAAYLLVLFALQFKDIYTSWHVWASPEIDAKAYGALALLYGYAIATPFVLVINSLYLLRYKKIKWYLAIIMFCLLMQSSIVGKLLLLISVLVYLYCRFAHNRQTNETICHEQRK